LRILIADDNADIRSAMAMLLTMQGHQVMTAADGIQAVAAVAETPPDAALLDISMPGLDGLSACRRIRAAPGGTDIKLIAVTGWDQDQDPARSREAGFDAHLTKPVGGGVLLDLLAQLCPD
jgi:CheY-like chemotaxis protein